MKNLPKESKRLGINALCSKTRFLFEKIPDNRKSNKELVLADVLSAGYCLFSLKFPSLLSFEKRFPRVHRNLKNIFNIKAVPSDTAIRAILDEVNPELIRPVFKGLFNLPQRGRQLKKLAFKIGTKEYYILSVDGSGYFSSNKVHGPCCLEKTSRSGVKTYYHQMLGASIVSPNLKTVIPVCPEPIIKQDGESKNDCERNAAKRFITKFREDHPQLPTIAVEDSLASNEPHIKELQKHNCDFILGAKPGNHKFLFQKFAFESRKRGNTTRHAVREGEITHEFEFINQIPLKGSEGVKVNFISYTQKQPGKKDKHFTWVTSLTATAENVYQVMRAGRARWRIENETFNTLKNQGYHFEHNYGHGYKNLSVVFAYLMMLAFLVDQVMQLSSKLYKVVAEQMGSKRQLWETVRGAVQWIKCESMEEIYQVIATDPQMRAVRRGRASP